MTAFVLGNGVSRQDIDINQLMKIDQVYACNAVYRTHTVSALVATDRPIATAIQESGYAKRARFYTRRPMAGTGAEMVPKKYFGVCSGLRAISLAAMDGHDQIYILGFDMGPNDQGRFNNVFASTEFYKTAGSPGTYTGNWIRQITTIMQDFKSTTFIRVYGATTAPIPQIESQPNYQRLQLPDFLARINNPKDL